MRTGRFLISAAVAAVLALCAAPALAATSDYLLTIDDFATAPGGHQGHPTGHAAARVDSPTRGR